jgi:hypothetical protein
MDHIKVLKRAFQITWDYRALWIFGIILALTVGGGPKNPGSPDSGPQPEYTFEGKEEIPESIELPDGREVTVPQALREASTWIAIGATLCGLCCCALIVWIVVTTVARYVAETALIRMVDDYEETGEKRTIREGFRMGWSRASFRLFLVDLLVFLAGLVVFLPLFLLLTVLVGLSIAAIESLGAIVLGVIGIVAASGLFFLLILLAILVGMAVQFVKPYIQRACVLEGLGVIDSIKYGLSFVRRHLLWDAIIMQLIVIGLYFGWFVAMVFVTFALIAAALVAAAIPVLILGGLGSLIIGWPAWVVGGVFGALSFIVVVVVPAVFLRGWEMTFISTLWTLTYRELRALEGLDEKEPWEESDSHELH